MRSESKLEQILPNVDYFQCNLNRDSKTMAFVRPFRLEIVCSVGKMRPNFHQNKFVVDSSRINSDHSFSKVELFLNFH